jgi:hypothetical protein
MNKQVDLPESQQKIQDKLEEIYKNRDQQKTRSEFLEELSEADRFLVRITSMKYTCEGEGFDYWRESGTCEDIFSYIKILNELYMGSRVKIMQKFIAILMKGIAHTENTPEKPPTRPETFRSEALAEEWEKKHGETEQKYDDFLDKMADIFDEYMELYQENEQFDNIFYDAIYTTYQGMSQAKVRKTIDN